MPIKPKFSVGKLKRSKTYNKEFINREKQREIFINKIINNRKKKYTVLVYYGIGGIGKSSLIQQLQKDLLQENENNAYTFINLEDKSLQNPSRALLQMKHNIISKKKLSLPHFEIAYTIYFSKKNPDIVYNEKNLPFLEDFSIVSELFDAGIIANIANKAYKYYKNTVLNKEIKEELIALEKFSIIEIEERLSSFFAYDIQNKINHKEIKSFTIFIDTYEAIWLNSLNEINKYKQDSWVREFVAELPNSLFVFSGREKLRWCEYDSEWNNYLEHYIVNSLIEVDTIKLLVEYGINNKDIQNKIFTISKGHPYYIDLLVDLYYELLNKNQESKILELSLLNKREILDLFMAHLNNEEVEILKLLTIPNFYNEEIFELLIMKYYIGYKLNFFDNFNRFSFVKNEKDKYYIHNIMKESISNYLTSQEKKNIHKILAEYYEQKLENKAFDIDTNLSNFVELNYHYSNFYNEKQYKEWLNSTQLQFLKSLQIIGLTKFLSLFLDNIVQKYGINIFEHKLFSIYVDMIHLSGSYEKAVKIIIKYLSNKNINEIYNDDILIHLQIRRIHHQMFFMPVKALIEELLKMEKTIDKEKYKKRYGEILFMIGGNLGILYGDYNFSRKWLVKSIRFSNKNNFDDLLVRTLRKYSDNLRVNNHLIFSEKICKIALKLAQKNNYFRYEIYLTCSMSEILRANKNYDKSINLYNQAKENASKLGIKGWEAHCLLGLGETYFDVGEIDKALSNYKNALSIYKPINQIWGKIQANIGIMKCYLKQNNNIYIELAKENLKIAKKMNYTKEAKILKKILEKNSLSSCQSNQLMFL